MLQSCETLITKINEWQKAILELEKLSDDFLNTGDEALKKEIDATKQEIKKLAEEYQKLAYPELPNGEKLFWLELEMIQEIAGETGWMKDNIKIKNNHLVGIDLSNINLSQFSLDFSLFLNLERLDAMSCELKKLPCLSGSVKKIWIGDNPDIEIPDDLTYLNNLQEFNAWSCKLKRLPRFSGSVKDIYIKGNLFSKKEKQRIKKEYPNAKIEF